MSMNRRELYRGLTSSVVGLGVLSSHQAFAADPPAKAATGSGFTRFFQNPMFEMIFLTALGRAYHAGGNVGKVLHLAGQVKDGDFEGAFKAFKAAGDEARVLAEESLKGRHRESARQAYLWAQNYYDSATYFVDGSKDPSRFLPTWELLHDCWVKSLPLFDPPIEPVEIPYEDTKLHGFYFQGGHPPSDHC